MMNEGRDEEARPSLLAEMVDSVWLMQQEFAQLQYVVPEMIPEGLTLLVAAPKIGKSWLVLGLGLASASGGMAFGHVKVDPRPVLYLALEDGHRRLQSRLRSLDITAPPGDLNFIIDVMGNQFVPTITEFLERYQDRAPLIILDTLGKAMPPCSAGETSYARDYRIAGALKRLLANVPGASLIVVHHTRKAEGIDFLDAVSGTQGLSGAADTVAVLRRDRGERGAILSITSRDAKEGEYALLLKDNGEWELNGSTLAEAARSASMERLTDGVGDRMSAIISFVNAHTEGVRRGEVALILGMDENSAGRYLRRAAEAGRVLNPSRGLYTPVSSVSSVSNQNAEQDTQDTQDTRSNGHRNDYAWLPTGGKPRGSSINHDLRRTFS